MVRKFRLGQAVKVRGYDRRNQPVWDEIGKVTRWHPANTTKQKQEMIGLGYYPIRFEDGGSLCIHESALRAH